MGEGILVVFPAGWEGGLGGSVASSSPEVSSHLAFFLFMLVVYADMCIALDIERKRDEDVP